MSLFIATLPSSRSITKAVKYLLIQNIILIFGMTTLHAKNHLPKESATESKEHDHSKHDQPKTPHASHKAHVHGRGKINVVFIPMTNTLSIHVELPAADALGFEHAPNTPEDLKKVQTFFDKLDKQVLKKSYLIANNRCQSSQKIELPWEVTPYVSKSSLKITTLQPKLSKHKSKKHMAKKHKDKSHHMHSDLHLEEIVACSSLKDAKALTFGFVFENFQEKHISWTVSIVTDDNQTQTQTFKTEDLKQTKILGLLGSFK